MGFRTDIRAAAVALLEGYKTATTGLKLQIYPGRPASIYPPTAFVDAINEGNILYTAGPRQRSPEVQIILIQGVFDTEEATTQQDELVDGFIDFVTANKHQAGGATLVTVTQVEDLPAYIPDWLNLETPPIFYASRVTLTGFVAEGSLI